jgi:hypothetical protein
MSAKYHTRAGYEQLYVNILHARAVKNTRNLSWFSDYKLLCLINQELEFQNCITLTAKELEMELH